jgi:pyridoxamine 5'-phosphate oxidase
MPPKIIPNVDKDYSRHSLNEADVSSDPVLQFDEWFNEALFTDPEANAMFLATSTKRGRPSVRTVLLKSFDESGFVFFTNYNSRKGKEINENPYASVLFFWKESSRQVRLEGRIEKVTAIESDQYFHSRNLESQVAASVSPQSEVIESRIALEKKYEGLKEKMKDGVIPLPDYWGGYRLIPDKFEFWQGRNNRMHDRILYSKTNEGWKIERLAP